MPSIFYGHPIENRQFSDIVWGNMGDLSSGIGIINDLSGSMFEGLGQVGTVLGVIDMAHQAIMLYDNGELSSRNIALYGVDILLMSGETWGFGVGIAWHMLDYETEELREQGKKFLIDMENGMGKNGDFSSIKYYWGY
ncbi:MAG: hypothetical protein K2I90_13160 [Odoribacter sp.]|nr:hypothetical protein [Odoribacter sp.]